MGTPETDKEPDEQHPLSKDRPGVYVQVSTGGRKKKKNKRGKARSKSQAPAPPLDAAGSATFQAEQPYEPMLRPSLPAEADGEADGPTESEADDHVHSVSTEQLIDRSSDAAPRDSEPGAQSELVSRDQASKALAIDAAPHPRGEITQPLHAVGLPSAQAESHANTNGRADIVKVEIPVAPRVPDLARPSLPRASQPWRDASKPRSGAALLDAPTSLRPDSMPAQRGGLSWAALIGVALMAAIIAAAVVVALQDFLHGSPVAPSAVAQPGPEPPPEPAQPEPTPPNFQATAPEAPAPPSVEPTAAPAVAAPAPALPHQSKAPASKASPPKPDAPSAPEKTLEPDPRSVTPPPAAPPAEALPANPY